MDDPVKKHLMITEEENEGSNGNLLPTRPSPEAETAKCSLDCRRRLKTVLFNICLLIIFAGYLAAGMALFLKIEAPAAVERRTLISEELESLKSSLLRDIDDPMFEKKEVLEQYLAKYENLSWGQILTMVYSLIGVPLMIVILLLRTKSIYWIWKNIYNRCCCSGCCLARKQGTSVELSPVPLTCCVFTIFGLLAGVACIICFAVCKKLGTFPCFYRLIMGATTTGSGNLDVCFISKQSLIPFQFFVISLVFIIVHCIFDNIYHAYNCVLHKIDQVTFCGSSVKLHDTFLPRDGPAGFEMLVRTQPISIRLYLAVGLHHYTDILYQKWCHRLEMQNNSNQTEWSDFYAGGVSPRLNFFGRGTRPYTHPKVTRFAESESVSTRTNRSNLSMAVSASDASFVTASSTFTIKSAPERMQTSRAIAI